MSWLQAQRITTREPTLEELRAKALFFGMHAVQSRFEHGRDEYPWCVEHIDDLIGIIWMRGQWHRTEYEALEEFFRQCKLHGYPEG